jgi:glutathione S-transferase
MITVHHLENSRSQRVLWLLEELELPYEIKRYQRDKKTMLAPPELRAVHPLGKSPVVTDDERVLAESGAIIEYLVERYGNGRLVPASGSDERLRYTYWLHYAEGSLMPLLLLSLVMNRISEGPVPFFIRPVAKAIAAGVQRSYLGPQCALQLTYIEGELGKSTWFAGEDFSAADVRMSFPIEAGVERLGIERGRYPRIVQYLERAHARPAYQRAQRKVGDFVVSKL